MERAPRYDCAVTSYGFHVSTARCATASGDFPIVDAIAKLQEHGKDACVSRYECAGLACYPTQRA